MSADDRAAYWKRRATRAETALEWARRENDQTLKWARGAFDQERRVRDRCAYLYSLAVKHGATPDEVAMFFTLNPTVGDEA